MRCSAMCSSNPSSLKNRFRVEAFIRPALEVAGGAEGESFTRLRAVLSGENSDLFNKLVAENFDRSSALFIDALCECLPQLPREQAYWRFHFLLGTIYYTAAGPHRIRVPYWQGPGPMALVLEVAAPGEDYRVLRMDRPLEGSH